MNDYIQCKLRQNDNDYIAYIPAYGAKRGLTMKLEDREGRWLVVDVYKDSRVNEEMAKMRSNDYRKHRDATDI